MHPSPESSLEKLVALRDSGVLAPEEFQRLTERLSVLNKAEGACADNQGTTADSPDDSKAMAVNEAPAVAQPPLPTNIQSVPSSPRVRVLDLRRGDVVIYADYETAFNLVKRAILAANMVIKKEDFLKRTIMAKSRYWVMYWIAVEAVFESTNAKTRVQFYAQFLNVVTCDLLGACDEKMIEVIKHLQNISGSSSLPSGTGSDAVDTSTTRKNRPAAPKGGESPNPKKLWAWVGIILYIIGVCTAFSGVAGCKEPLFITQPVFVTREMSFQTGLEYGTVIPGLTEYRNPTGGERVETFFVGLLWIGAGWVVYSRHKSALRR